MYLSYFGLAEAPFSIAVNPRYLFMSARHRDALAHLLYGVDEGGGFILLTGEVGTGKTTVTRCLLEQLPSHINLALVLNPALNALELLATVCDELGVGYDKTEQQSLKTLTDKLHDYLLASHAEGKRTVLLIDEAQHLQYEVLEQIRLLTNLETNSKKLLQIILIGQPELRTLLNKPALRQLAQRITARYQLKPLNLQETDEYIRHRLQIAGLPGNQRPFPSAIVKRIYKASKGIPRIINVLCDRMLLGAYGQNKSQVNSRIFKQAIAEVMGEEKELIPSPPNYRMPLATSAVAILAILLTVWQWPRIYDFATASIVQSERASPEISDTPSSIAAINKPEFQLPPPLMANRQQAIIELAASQGWTASEEDIGCNNQLATALRCEQLRVDSWQQLMTYNRPAVLTIVGPGKLQRFVTLIAIVDDQAVVSYHGESLTLPLVELGQQWTGEFLFFWLSNQYYAGSFGLNAHGPMVTWLADQFAKLDGQSSPLANNLFNQALEQRVVMFQQANALTADGVVGLKTLLKLNEHLGIATPLINADIIVNQDSANLLSANKVGGS